MSELEQSEYIFYAKCIDSELCFDCIKYNMSVIKTIKGDCEEASKEIILYQLLCFDNIGMCDTNITYSQIGRATLIDKYPEQIEKLKLFSSTKLNKVNIVTDAGYRHDLHITQQNIRFNIHSYMCSKIICIDKTDICFDDIENIMLKAEKEIKITII